MKLEQQVCSLELAKKLKELGVKQESLFWWNGNREWEETEVAQFGGGFSSVRIPREDLEWVITRCASQSPACQESCSAFTVAELLNIAPASTSLQKRTDMETKTIPRYYVESFDHYRKEYYDENTANALAKFLLENKLI